MRFSTRGRYGVQIMVDLAQNSTEGPIFKSVAEGKAFWALSRTVNPELRKAGLVKSMGCSRRLSTSKKPEKIYVGDVIQYWKDLLHQ